MRAQFKRKFEDMVSVENLLQAWQEFVRGKRMRKDVEEFSLRLMDNILNLHDELIENTYKHGGYQSFHIFDPKPRHIHKAIVRDRLVHRAIYRKLYPFFDRTFTADSFSCRKGKGTHRAQNRFREFGYKVSKNNTRTCWVLKCDIRKFFESIDHTVLKGILTRYIPDKNIPQLLENVVGSFSSKGKKSKGLPLGNLTSQLFVNIYMNEFDQFAKHKLKAEHYIRYADDFVVFSRDRERLLELIAPIEKFLRTELKLELHPRKISIETLAPGVDFLGWVHFSDHRVLRTATKKRMFRKLDEKFSEEGLQSYLGLLSHGNEYNLTQKILDVSKK